jgi:hypothetical protein
LISLRAVRDGNRRMVEEVNARYRARLKPVVNAPPRREREPG